MGSRIIAPSVVALFVAGGVAAWAFPEPAEMKPSDTFLGLLSVGDVVVRATANDRYYSITVVTPEDVARLRPTPEEAEELEQLRGISNARERRLTESQMARYRELAEKDRVRDYKIVEVGADYVAMREKDGGVEYIPTHRIGIIRNDRVPAELPSPTQP